MNAYTLHFLKLVVFGLACVLTVPPPVFSEIQKASVVTERFDFADGLYARQMYEMAATEYRNLIQNYPDHERIASAYFRLAESLYSLKRYDEALVEYQTFLEKFPGHEQTPVATLRLAEIMESQGRTEEALQHFSSLTETANPQVRLSARYQAAKILFEQGKYEQAQSLFSSLMPCHEDNPYCDIAAYYLGRIAVERGNYEKAQSYFQKVAETDKLDLRQLAFFSLGHTAYQQKKFEQAREFFLKAHELSPSSSIGQDAYVNYLNALYELDRFQEIIERYRTARESLTQQTPASFIVANAQMQQGTYDEAASTFEDILTRKDLSPEDRERAQLGRLEALLMAGRRQEALAFLSQLPAQPLFFQDRWHFLRAEAYQRQKDAATAAAELRALLQGYPDSPYAKSARLRLGYLYLDQGKDALALEAFEDFLKQYPDDPASESALINIIALQIKLKKWEEATQKSEEFLKQYPESPQTEEIHYQLASLYLQEKNYGRAYQLYQDHLKRYADKEKEDEILFSLGYTQQQAGSCEEAIGYYQKIDAQRLSKELRYAALKNTAYCFVQLGKLEEAAPTYRELIRQFPENDLNAEIYFWLADYFLKHEDGEGILEVMESFRHHPHWEDRRYERDYFLGEGHLLQKNFTQALSSFDTVLSANGDLQANAYFGKGRALMGVGQWDRALVAFENAIQNADEDYQLAMKARVKIAEVYLQKKAYLEAAKAYMSVAILYDDEKSVPEALLKAGEAFELAGRKAESRKAYEELVRRYANHPAAGQAQQRLTGT